MDYKISIEELENTSSKTIDFHFEDKIDGLDFDYSKEELKKLKRELLINGVETYKKRYGITEDNSYKKEDIFKEDNKKVKRLIKKIKNEPMLLYKNND